MSHLAVVRHIDELTTVSAMSLISMTWTTLGKDKIGRSIQFESADMAMRLHLYHGFEKSSSLRPLDLQDDRVKIAAAAVAWGSFNFQM
jgi:hypothetical protein